MEAPVLGRRVCKSKAGQGGRLPPRSLPGKACIVAYVGHKNSHMESGLKLDSVRVSDNVS